MQKFIVPLVAKVEKNFLKKYQDKITAGTLQADPEQLLVVQEMQRIHDKIESYYHPRLDNKIKHLLHLDNLFSSEEDQQTIKGIYLWGGVGRGKTFLLDLFFECLTTKNKLRIHFHRFMQVIHETIEQLGDIEEPLKETAKIFAKKYQIICLDEIIVIDITDAMILAELFKQLLKYRVTLLFTSNTAPEDLYKNGLQRSRFLPTIKLLLSSNIIIKLGGENDYRLHALENTEVYQLSSNINTHKNIQSLYDFMTGGIKLHQHRNDLIINYRQIPVLKWESGIVWFSFDMICNTHRDSSDYIRIATFFSTVIVSDIYCLNTEQDDIARRFINMVDVFYDRHINLVVSAQSLPEQLYSGTRLHFEFSRTQSRLREMQTKKYLSKNKVFKEMLDKDLLEVKQGKIDNNSPCNDPTRFGDWVSNAGRCSDF
jgi:cell division protein ZapE